MRKRNDGRVDAFNGLPYPWSGPSEEDLCATPGICRADIRGDANGDGEITGADEYGEELYGVTVVFNADDDNGNDVPDWEETDVDGEDDLVELRLSAGSCSHGDWPSWSLSWDPAAPLVVWWESDKYCDDCLPGTEEEPIYNLTEYPDAHYPLSILPRSVWLEATDAIGDEYDITFTVHADAGEKRFSSASDPSDPDTVKVRFQKCSPAPGERGRHYIALYKQGPYTAISAVISTRARSQRPLCYEAPLPHRVSMLSAAYLNISAHDVIQTTPPKNTDVWVQMGYLSSYTANAYEIIRTVYIECAYGPDLPNDRYIKLRRPYGHPTPGNHAYLIYRGNDQAKWDFYYDLTDWGAEFEHEIWNNRTGDSIFVGGELENKEDTLAGVSADPCVFSFIRVHENYSGSAELESTKEENLIHPGIPDWEDEWGIAWLAGNSISIWDKKIP